MVSKLISEEVRSVVDDESVLTLEELKLLASIFDVLIDVDYYLKHTKGTQ